MFFIAVEAIHMAESLKLIDLGKRDVDVQRGDHDVEKVSEYHVVALFVVDHHPLLLLLHLLVDVVVVDHPLVDHLVLFNLVVVDLVFHHLVVVDYHLIDHPLVIVVVVRRRCCWIC